MARKSSSWQRYRQLRSGHLTAGALNVEAKAVATAHAARVHHTGSTALPAPCQNGHHCARACAALARVVKDARAAAVATPVEFARDAVRCVNSADKSAPASGAAARVANAGAVAAAVTIERWRVAEVGAGGAGFGGGRAQCSWAARLWRRAACWQLPAYDIPALSSARWMSFHPKASKCTHEASIVEQVWLPQC